MKSEVAKWIDSWPLWKRKVARGILSRELTNPLRENRDSKQKRWYSDEQRETEK